MITAITYLSEAVKLFVRSDIVLTSFINNTNHLTWSIGVYRLSRKDRVSHVMILVMLNDGIWHIMYYYVK